MVAVSKRICMLLPFSWKIKFARKSFVHLRNTVCDTGSVQYLNQKQEDIQCFCSLNQNLKLTHFLKQYQSHQPMIIVYLCDAVFSLGFSGERATWWSRCWGSFVEGDWLLDELLLSNFMVSLSFLALARSSWALLGLAPTESDMICFTAAAKEINYGRAKKWHKEKNYGQCIRECCCCIAEKMQSHENNVKEFTSPHCVWL